MILEKEREGFILISYCSDLNMYNVHTWQNSFGIVAQNKLI